jgi:surfeit locus 1 family protein
VLRTALKPRWLGLFAIVVAVMVTFGTLGLWQLNVARDTGRAQEVAAAPTRPVADLATVLVPHSPFPHDADGRRINVKGRYDGLAQILVTPRLLGGRRGYWVVTPLVVESTGARIAVVRGFVTEPSKALPPDPTGRVTEVVVSGTLVPGESASRAAGSAGAGTSLPEGQMSALDLSLLVNRWPGEIYNAFVFATAEQPDVTSVASPAVERVPPPESASGALSWRNAAYALQWWVFALFAAYMWWRMVRDDYASEIRERDIEQQDLAAGSEGKATNV